VLAGIAVIRRMRLGTRFESTLTGLTFHADPRIAASAVMALGESGASHAIPAVRAALHHDDPRVQANAVEALMRLGAAETRDLVAFLAESRHNRPRANAVVACTRTDRSDGERRLLAMLGDDDPLHRISAVWAARRVRSMAMLGELRRLANEDEIGVVRRRASAAARAMSPAYE
jgi:HEAT repeat protein